MKEVNLADIPVMYIIAESLEKVEEAFRKLEAHIPSMKGRKFYGAYQNGIYGACVAIKEGDNPRLFGLKANLIPGGKYISPKMDDWP